MKMKQITQALQQQKDHFQQQMKQNNNPPSKKSFNVKYGRSISCDKHKEDGSINEVQQKKIMEQVVRKNSLMRDTLEDIEEDYMATNSYLHNDYAESSGFQVVGLSKRMLENSFVNYSQKKQSDNKLQVYLDKYKISDKAKKYSQFQPIYKLDPQMRPQMAIEVQRQQ